LLSELWTPLSSNLPPFERLKEQFIPFFLFVSKSWHCTDLFTTELLTSVLSEWFNLLLARLLEEIVSSVLAWQELGGFPIMYDSDSHGCSKHWWEVRRLLKNERQITGNIRTLTLNEFRMGTNETVWKKSRIGKLLIVTKLKINEIQI
jgi:hypothetical protein